MGNCIQQRASCARSTFGAALARLLAPCVLATTVVGCLATAGEVDDSPPDGPEPEAELATTSAALHGLESYGAPEIGIISRWDTVNQPVGCTATAIAPNVVITARHCLLGGGGEIGVGHWYYTIEPPLTVRRHQIHEVWLSGEQVYGQPPPQLRDIALLRIHPASPFHREIRAYAPGGSTAWGWGFGGFDCAWSGRYWYDVTGSGRKRFATFTVAGNQITAPIFCPGDSGGPVIAEEDGRIFGIMTHGQGTRPGDTGIFENIGDIWGDVMTMTFFMQITASQ
jgi:Trypsin